MRWFAKLTLSDSLNDGEHLLPVDCVRLEIVEERPVGMVLGDEPVLHVAVHHLGLGAQVVEDVVVLDARQVVDFLFDLPRAAVVGAQYLDCDHLILAIRALHTSTMINH